MPEQLIPNLPCCSRICENLIIAWIQTLSYGLLSMLGIISLLYNVNWVCEIGLVCLVIGVIGIYTSIMFIIGLNSVSKTHLKCSI